MMKINDDCIINETNSSLILKAPTQSESILTYQKAFRFNLRVYGRTKRFPWILYEKKHFLIMRLDNFSLEEVLIIFEYTRLK